MIDNEKLLKIPSWRWHFKTTVRILIVADGGITLDNTNPSGFGLGKVIDTLQNQTFYSNARFLITGALRNGGTPGINPAATSKQFKFTGFSFNMAGFNINDYDQVWFFGFAPGNDGSSNDANIDAAISALKSPAEIKILSTWMNTQRGGVLAIGDHHYLGASLCHNIPRVRKMRKWTNADHVPPIKGFNRKDTNQFKSLVGGEIPFDAQSDDVPQPIEVLKKRVHDSIFKIKTYPHPILCGAGGVIDILPDHPHEGEVLGTRYDTNSGGVPVNLAGNYPAGVPEFPNRTAGAGKPEPQIIALGHPHNYVEHNKNIHDNPSHANDTTPFGLISVYDGAEAGIGRIVTDSTWHHWFNINLVGLDTPATAPLYSKIQNYYTNVAVWLCNEDLRHSMLSSWIWGYLVREFDPMRFSVQDSIWRLGISAKDTLGRDASQCTGTEWIFVFLPPLREKFRLPDLGGPCLTCPPFEVFEIAILGGIMKELIPLVEKYRLTENFERQFINPKQISKAISRGIENGHKELLKTLKESIGRTQKLYKISTTALQKTDAALFEPKINTARFKIEIESILFNSPILIGLTNSEKSFISARVSNQFMTLNKEPLILDLGKRQEFKSSSGMQSLHVKTNFHLIQDTFQDGEEIKIELFLNDTLYKEENKIYEFILQGDIETWRGNYHTSVNELIQNKTAIGVWINVS